jgi:hypothetical protein
VRDRAPRRRARGRGLERGLFWTAFATQILEDRRDDVCSLTLRLDGNEIPSDPSSPGDHVLEFGGALRNSETTSRDRRLTSLHRRIVRTLAGRAADPRG